MELENRTPLPARVLAGGVPTGPISVASLVRSRGQTPDGVSVRGLLVVKATLEFRSGEWLLAREQLPIWEFDQEGPPFFEKDIMYQKGGVDLAILGSARAPRGPVPRMEVSVRIGGWSRKLSVFGDRSWRRHLRRFVPTDPKPFSEMPLTWANAYGGTTRDHEGNPSPSPLNPAGKGYTLPNEKSQVEGVPLPNVEDPAHLIASIDDRPDPVGFAFLPLTSGLRLREGVKPKPPDGMEILPRIHNAAPPGLVLPAYPAGETMEVHGMTVPSPWRAVLPAFPARAALRGPGGETPLPLATDTICLFVDQQLMYLTAKGRFDYDLDDPPDLTALVDALDGRRA